MNRTSNPLRTILTTGVATAVGLGLVIGSGTQAPAAAATTSVSDLGALRAALADCTSPPNVITLADDIADPIAELTVGCDTSIELERHDLTVAGITINPGITLSVSDRSVTDPASAGTITADSTNAAGRPGIATSGATFITRGAVNVVANGGRDAAGIGGALNESGGTVETNDTSHVNAAGGGLGAGIGGGNSGDGGVTTSNGSSTIVAVGAPSAAGIGGGAQGDGGTTTSNGSSSITATGARESAGIGGGQGGDGGMTTSNDSSSITATGLRHGAGIGGGDLGDGGTTISTGNSTMRAVGIQGSAGIGGGYSGDGGITSSAGNSSMSAMGGATASGIGGGVGGDGGSTTVAGTSTMHATGSFSAVGGGAPLSAGGTDFGSLKVTSGTLVLGSNLVVPASASPAPALPQADIGADGSITTDAGASIVGDGTSGSIDNGGAITLPTPQVTGNGVSVLDRHYAVSFDTNGAGASAAPASVTVFADTFAHGDRTFPPAPTRPGYTFDGWRSTASGAGTEIAATSDLTAFGPADGTGPVAVTAYARWSPIPPPTPQVTVGAPSIANTTSPERGTGSPAVGDTLTATPGTSTPPSATLGYTWTRTDPDSGATRSIAGATSPDYVVTAADLGSRLGVTATVSAPGYTPGTASSGLTGIVQPEPPSFEDPGLVISGTARVGRQLTALTAPTAEMPAPVDGQVTTYQWQTVAPGSETGTDVPGATQATYTPTADQAGQRIRLVLTRTAPGYTPRADTGTTRPVDLGRLPFERTRITGKARVGHTLTATQPHPVTPPAGYVRTFRWAADGRPLRRSATSASYTVPPRLSGTEVTVAVTASAPGYQPRSYTTRPRRIG